MTTGDVHALALQRSYLVNVVSAVFPGVDRGLIEDGCAAAYETVWRKRDDVEADRPFGYLFVIALNAVRCEIRHRHREVGEAFDFATTPAHHDVDTAMAARDALGALSRLKPQQRRVLGLRAGGFRYDEIQDLTGRTYTWVSRHIAEGTRALREVAAA